MIEDTTLTQFIVEPIDPTLVLASAPVKKRTRLKPLNTESVRIRKKSNQNLLKQR